MLKIHVNKTSAKKMKVVKFKQEGQVVLDNAPVFCLKFLTKVKFNLRKLIRSFR